MTESLLRCPWGGTNDILMRYYHDNEWGKPCFDEQRLFEMLILEGAQAVLRLGSLKDFIWGYVSGEPVLNHWERQEDIPATTPLSDQISRDMKKLGFKSVGSTIIYSYLQAIGVVNDHLTWCAFRERAMT